jgi:glutamate-5-semialdehyde dehydrogenase
MMDIQNYLLTLGKQAKTAYRILALASDAQKNQALTVTAEHLWQQRAEILAENAKDMALGQEKGLSVAMLDRLRLDESRIAAMRDGVMQVANFPDPVGRELEAWSRPNGLHIRKITVPLGVIGIIYESRPNVTADAGALCIKSGNAAILRGGSDSVHSSSAIVACIHAGLRSAGLPETCVQLVTIGDRELVGMMLRMTQWIDVIVPRGGKSLTARISEESRIPTIQHLDGNCHIYIHAEAELQKVLRVVHNAKLRRTGVCGAMESLIIDASVANAFLPRLLDTLPQVEVRGDAQACHADARIIPASEEDFAMEYLDSILSVKVVGGVQEAIDHINRYSSHHTDCIMTENAEAAALFQHAVDSAIVMHNTSTQFADGGEFCMGAEIGISTGRLHARGPVGAAQLVTYKYSVSSDGAVRA